MPVDVIKRKLDQMRVLISELESLLSMPFAEFKKDFSKVRAAERNFQLLIELASDINANIVADKGLETPDSYKESFKRIASLDIIDEASLPRYIKSANLRNILVHEYDFDEDDFIFYNSATELLPIYKDYIGKINSYLARNNK